MYNNDYTSIDISIPSNVIYNTQTALDLAIQNINMKEGLNLSTKVKVYTYNFIGDEGRCVMLITLDNK